MIRLAAFACGLLCGIGLCVSALFQPQLLHRFLSPAETWDPELGVALVTAFVVAVLAFAVTRRLTRPLLGGEFDPLSGVPSWKWIVGGVLFGLGWGVAGYFPAAALVSLGMFAPGAVIFLASALVGMVLHDLVTKRSWLTIMGLRSGG